MNTIFRNLIDSKYIYSKHVLIRWKKTQAFIKKYDANSGLDIGDRTPFTEELETFFNCSFDNTVVDLDEGKLKGKYDIVTAFEIIEHLYNPLHLLNEISNVLKKGGKLYLSTPKGKPQYLWSEHHFHEMSDKSLRALIERAGFSIIRTEEIRIQPLLFYFTGIRPILRFIFEKHLLMELIHQ